jgi:rod shape-determining protein MreD
MSNLRPGRHLPFLISIIIALALTMMPLPRAVDAFRPDWVALIVIFWSLSVPRSYGVGIAWLIGLVLDVSQGTLLGQHALALCIVAFISVRFHLLMRVFPLLQLTATVFALLSLYQFLLFWINGVAGINAPAQVYWAPILTGTIVWPVLHTLSASVQYRARARN